jgi:hypothetical protein
MLELLNKVWRLWVAFASRVFGWCVGIAVYGSAPAGLPCSWFDVEIRCRVTRLLVLVGGAFESSLGFDLYLKPQKSPSEVQLTLNDRFTLSTNALTVSCP